MKHTLLSLALLSALLVAAGSARAETTPSLSLSSALVSPGVYKITLSLADASGDGSSLADYDANIFVDGTYLSFVNVNGSKPYLSTAASAFPNELSNSLPASNTLRVSYGSDYPGWNNLGTLDLGYFEVQTSGPLPAAGTRISLGTTTTGTDTAGSGGSDLDDYMSFANVLQSTNGVTVFVPASAPEPDGAAVLAMGVALLAVRRGRTRRSGT